MNKLIEDGVAFPEEYLTLSTSVSIGECLEEFVELYQVNRHWINEQGVLFKHINSSRHSPMVELEYLEELLNALCSRTMKKVMAKRKEDFVDTPLKDWL